jgi:hypothetical protein
MPTTSLDTNKVTIFDADNVTADKELGRLVAYGVTNADTTNTVDVFLNGRTLGTTVGPGVTFPFRRLGKIWKVEAKSSATAIIHHGMIEQ